MGNLLPDRHPNKDFFILDVSDASPKDDLASMEHPVFSLSVKPDMRELDYTHNGRRLRVVPSGRGLATIMDKDILLYCISKLVHKLNHGKEITPWVELSAHEVMVATNWNTGKRDYGRFEDALLRLRGTTIVTDIRTDDHMQTKGFGLIEEFEIDRKDENGELSPFGRMTKVRIKVSDWTFRAVKGMEVLTINPAYFRLRRPLERRLYELARKHVGEQERPFSIKIANLQKKVGSNSPEKKFRFFLKEIAADEHLPDYLIRLEGDQVVMSRAPRKPRQQASFDFGTAALQVSAEGMERAREAAPGYDIYALYDDWCRFCLDKGETVRNPDGAFIGFCRKKHEKQPLR
ncbi:replication initiator protein A [Jiella pacifica]|uniref:Plasmid replication initiator RepA n=1 Tax=Jiella pacifica TaxID=2696469 RepID=A0A6N9T8S0_9HYPH|nr:replication initiator protein A [Jiella pacifica]NDW07834.1 plasmid replication initiator RepA [Jiella pacifica]